VALNKRLQDEQRREGFSLSSAPGAEPLFRALNTFFSRRRKPANEEPTEMEIERDVKRLLHNKEDGAQLCTA